MSFEYPYANMCIRISCFQLISTGIQDNVVVAKMLLHTIKIITNVFASSINNKRCTALGFRSALKAS